MIDLASRLGPVELRTPLVGASGTVGSGWELADVADLAPYAALVAKSVSRDPWAGRPAPRVVPLGAGMLNGIGIQNPGIDAWVADTAPRIHGLDCPVWGSAVGTTPGEYAEVAVRLADAGVPVVEVNLSCPNLEDGRMFALDAARSARVLSEVRSAVSIPVAAKLSPNAEDIVAVASACAEAGADWVVLTNTAWGAGIDLTTRRPRITGVVGGYSGPPIKPLALRCVVEVHRALPDLPILGCGGVWRGGDVVEYLVAGASAVALGSVHFAEPKAATRILAETSEVLERLDVASVGEVSGSLEEW